MQPKVSIIVPIYNVEKYLNQCVDSLLKQTLHNIEIILVDDGTLDNSGYIADEYAKRESRVKVIHQKNSGLGPARNTGMNAATGEYIGFVDSDDWVKPQMFESLYNTAICNDSDIVVSGHCDICNGVITRKKIHPLAGKTVYTNKEILKIRKKFFVHAPGEKETEAFPMSVWIAIYRRSMVEENKLQFQEILSEDTIFNLCAYKCAQIISFTGETDYCYRKEEQSSITQSFSSKKLQRYQEFLNTLRKMAEQEKDRECLIRSKRMAIDCCRLYVSIVDNSGEPLKKRKHYVRDFATSAEIQRCWENYPVKTLPFQQRLFHKMIQKEWYGIALYLNKLRQTLKKFKKQ